LLNTTSTNGQQNNTFLDSSTNNFTITRNGTPTQGSITPYWPNGQWSNYFNGSSQLSIPNNAAFELGAGNFSYEAFVYATIATNTFGQGIISYGIAGNSSSSICSFNISDIGFLQLIYPLGSPALTDPASFPLNQWVHCVACRSGATLSLFVNGVRKATTTTSATLGTGGAMTIGGQWFANASTRQLQNGYISNARVLKGASAYDATLSTLTVPTAPLTPISNTSLLTCQSNRFIDNGSANSGQPFPITVNGTPRVQAFQPFSPTASYTTALYGGSGYFNGSTDNLSAASNAAFGFGTGDFTIDLWAYVANTSNAMSLVDLRNGVESTVNPLLYMAIGGAISWLVNGAVQIASAAITANSWVHIAVSRSSASTKIFINGTQSGSTYSDSNNYGQSSAFIGRGSVTTTLYVNGYLSNVRLVKGTAVYTAAFTPPTSPVTAITNTSLLLNMANAGIYDAAAQNNAITVGNAQVSIAQAQWPPSSMLFDGTGDYLNIPDSPALQPGSGNFTIEFWWRPIALTGYQTLFDKGFGSAGGLLIQTGNGNGILTVYVSGVAVITASSGTSVGSWDYYALVRSGSALTLYRNGSSVGSTTSSVNLNAASPWFIGAQNSPSPGSFSVNGYLQDFRITKAARTITASPTAAFPTR
jgi:hypothetical protein